MTYFTKANGFVEVMCLDDMIATDDYCYILASAENRNLIVGVGQYEEKPSWAGEDTKALRYREVLSNPVLELSNFFTIERSGMYMGLRNVVYNSSLFQTHDNAGFMYVLTYTEPTLSDWCYLIPTYDNGYWLFESGKYPVSSENWACGYLGPWNRRVAADEAIALNRRNTTGDEAGHYRLFRIARNDLLKDRCELLSAASEDKPLDFTWRITNPSFETGDERGWTLSGKDPEGNDEFGVLDYGMTNKAGSYLMNAYQWWSPSLGVSQMVEGLPCGDYELRAVVATWEGRTMRLTAGGSSITIAGKGDNTGIPVSLDVTIGREECLMVSAEATGEWWVEGHENETQTFFKLDNVRLLCKGIHVDGVAVPLSDHQVTHLVPGQWYYYDAPYHGDYALTGSLGDVVCTTDGDAPLDEVTTTGVEELMTLSPGRYYFMSNDSDATLSVEATHEVRRGTFTVAALNVDGLPNTVAYIKLNPDGPGSEGTKLISEYLARKGYDLIGVSEDFNYHGSLMSALSDNYGSGTVRSTLSVSGLFSGLSWPFDTDGLNLIWKYSTANAEDESWTRWNSTENTDGNQYVKKGFRHYVVTIEGSTPIDVYVLHMDAGGTNATNSRQSQWRQLAEAVNATPHDRPKLIIGDTNSRWTREDIAGNFTNLIADDLTVSDVWVEKCLDGMYPTTEMADLTDGSDPTDYTRYEVVDKILYLNPTVPNTLQLTPQSFWIEQDYTYGTIEGTDNTTWLGDHRPVVVRFSYAVAGNEVVTSVESLGPSLGPSLTPPVGGRTPAGIFDISGRRLPGMPFKKGVYIMGGKKRVKS